MLRALVIAVIVALAAVPVLADSVAEGLRIAREWCSECHVVERAQGTKGIADAPGFDDVARSDHTEMSLHVFLRTPHRTMPNIILTDAERDAIVAYITSLRPAD